MGEKNWTITRQNKSGSCSGYLQTSFSAEDQTRIVVDGKILFAIHEQALPISLALTATFDQSQTLSYLGSSVRIPGHRVTISSRKNDPGTLDIELYATEQIDGKTKAAKTLSIAVPKPITLVRTAVDQFKLQLPPKFQQTTLLSAEQNTSFLQGLQGDNFIESSVDEFSECAEFFENGKFSSENAVFNLGKILNFVTPAMNKMPTVVQKL